ncbi:MAG TPA: hemolysin family protein [Candidatus Ozemobacteraceae bacterium]|nr:hemolysin family protein [Candidatus Ozemobacteraceae bacterium]
MTGIDLLLFCLLLACSAFFSGTETALTAVSEGRLLSLADAGNHRARVALELIRNRGRTIGGMLVGNNIVNTLLAVFATNLFDNLIPAGSAPAWVAPALASVLSIVFLLIGGEVVPKNLGLAFQNTWVLWAAVPCRWFLTLISPAVWILNVLNRGLLGLLGKGQAQAERTIDDLLAMIKLSQKVGLIDPMELDLVRKALVLNEKTAREIMTPRSAICAVPDTASLDEIREAFDREQYSRLPVFHGHLDQVTGVLHVKELPPQCSNAEFDLKKHLRPPLIYPETLVIGRILEGMRQSKNHLAVLVDEFGSTSGLISLEDIVEQIFGDISDEFDQASAPRIQWLSSDRFEVEGRTSITEIQAHLAARNLPLLPEKAVAGVVSIAGLMQKELGAVPAPGAATMIGTYRFRVNRVREREIVSLKVTRMTGT